MNLFKLRISFGVVAKLKRKITIKAPAKINLFLDVIDKEKQGFHRIITLFQAVTLFDRIIIKKSDNDRITVNNDQLKGKPNIVEDVINCYRKRYKITQKFNIKIKKNIPVGAGLAGGSTDAAAVLWGINRLLGLNLSFNELRSISVSIGKDIPFFFSGGIQIGRRYGDILSRLSIKFKYYILIVYPGFEISTKESYKMLKKKDFNRGKESLKEDYFSIKEENLDRLTGNLYNIFEKKAFKKYPILKNIKNDLIKNGAENALMSGTGSAVFGIFKKKKNIKKVNKKLKNKYKSVIFVKPFHYGLS